MSSRTGSGASCALRVLVLLLPAFLVAGGEDLAAQGGEAELDRFLEECEEPEEHEEESRLSDQCRPLAVLPDRPRPIFELGEPFLATGTLGNGFRIPGGAVWQPALMAFGTLRTVAQGTSLASPGGTSELVEAASRLDLFGNLYLTQTERVVVGLRPLDRRGQFTSYTFHSDPEDPSADPFDEQLNAHIQTLFFEGDFSELFPNLDNDDSAGLDFYFAVGRQPLGFQDGLLVAEDAIDMIGLTRANMRLGGLVNTRITAVFGWGGLDRHGGAANVRDRDAKMFGLFSEIDTRSTTLEIDVVFVDGDDVTGDGFYAGIGDTRRIGRFNNTFRVLGSFPVGDETLFNERGLLIHNQFSWTPHHSHNLWYISTFLGIDHFRSAVRGPSAGGPLGRTGILFAAQGIGRVGAPLGNQADNAAGAALGHQMFFAETRQQLILEIAGRLRTKDSETGQQAVGLGGRFQVAMGRRFVFVVDAFGIYDFDVSESDKGGRIELVLKF